MKSGKLAGHTVGRFVNDIIDNNNIHDVDLNFFSLSILYFRRMPGCWCDG